MQAVLDTAGLEVTRLDAANQVIEAQAQANDGRADGLDRVILWLERDFTQPQRVVKVFLLYGRYDKIFGSPEPVRVRVDQPYELERTRRLRRLILDYRPPSGVCP